ncbi:ABC transporter permease [soil metagenome]
MRTSAASHRARIAARLAPALALATIAGLLALRDVDPSHLAPERSFCAASGSHPLGCGEAGVDLLAIVSHGVIRAIVLAAAVALIGFLVGAPLGALAALRRGFLERVVDRACDLVQAFPSFLLALTVLSSVRTPTRFHLFAVFSLTAWAPFARLALAEGRVLRGSGFVEAARALGRGPFAILRVHVLPNLFGVLAVQLGASAAAVVVSEAALGFVGLVPAGGASLGALLDQGTAVMLRAPHVLAVGSVAVFATSVSLLVAGRALGSRASSVDSG